MHILSQAKVAHTRRASDQAAARLLCSCCNGAIAHVNTCLTDQRRPPGQYSHEQTDAACQHLVVPQLVGDPLGGGVSLGHALLGGRSGAAEGLDLGVALAAQLRGRRLRPLLLLRRPDAIRETASAL